MEGMERGKVAGPACELRYRVRTTTRALATFVAVLLGLAWCAVVAAAAHADRLREDTVLLAGTTLVASLAAWFAFAAWTRQLVVTGTGIAVRHPFGADEIRMSELAGIRIRPLRGDRLIMFETRCGKQLMPLLSYATDRHYADWIGSLPNLDELERAASMRAWAADARLGADPAERAARAARWGRAARWDEAGGVLLLAWAFLFPRPYGLVMALLAVAPWVSLLLVGLSRGVLRANLRRNDARPQAATVLLCAPLVLFVRAFCDLDVLDLGRAVVFGAFAGLPLLVAAWTSQQRFGPPRGGALGFCAGLFWLYGFGLVTQGNVLLDRSTQAVFRERVIDRVATGGKHPTHKLRLAPWSLAGHGDWFDVPSSRYDVTVEGDTLCVFLHPGRLGLRWLTVDACPPGEAGTTARAPLRR